MLARRLVLLMCLVAGALSLSCSAQADYVTERVNLNRLGLQSNGGSWAPAMSADGRYVTFHSWATDLVLGDKNGHYDIYLRDRAQAVNYLISTGSGGALANDQSLYPAISADGLSVAFVSEASNLVPDDTNGFNDVFVRDWMTGPVERVSLATSGDQANGNSAEAAISGDGRFVAFRSDATNLTPGGNPRTGIYVRDRLQQTTECVSVSSAGILASQSSSGPYISSDGRYLLFTSYAGNLVPGDKNNTADVFLRDRQAGTTERISVATLTGQEGNGSSSASRPAVTPDGRYVVFSSLASNLVAGDANGVYDVLVRDRLDGTTELMSVSSSGVQGNNKSGADSYELAISDDGRYVEFCSLASNLVTGDTNNTWDTFVHDRLTGTTERVSVSTTGHQPVMPAGYYGLGLSADGLMRLFDSHSHYLVPNDTSSCINTFLRRPLASAVAAFSADPTNGLAPLTVQFTDTSINAPTSWSWSFGDGSSSGDRNPVHQYTAPGSYTVALTVASADGSNAATKADYIVVTAGHTFTVTAVAAASTIPSGGAVELSGSATDSLGHSVLYWSWSWSDGGAGGAFSPSAGVPNPVYTAARNLTNKPKAVVLTLTAACAGPDSASDTAAVSLTVQPVPHTLTVTATATPTIVASGGSVKLSATATDSLNHTGFAYAWSDNGAGGTFSTSAAIRNPTYTPPPNTSGSDRAVTLTVTATCKWWVPWVSASTSIAVTETSAPAP